MSEGQELPSGQESIQVYTPLRRRPRRRRSVYTRPISKRFLVVLFVFVIALVGAGAAYEHYHLAHFAVAVNGKPLVALATRLEAEQAIILAKKAYAPTAPDVVKYKDGDLAVTTLKSVMLSSSPQAAADVINQELQVELVGYAIFVERIPIVLLPSRDAATLTLSLALQRGLGDQRGIPTFKQRVTVDVLHLAKEKIGTVPVLTPEQAAVELVHPPRPQVYSVKLGDSFWSIANANGLLISDLDKLNPGMSHLLHEGDQIKLPDKPSPVTVVVRKVD